MKKDRLVGIKRAPTIPIDNDAPLWALGHNFRLDQIEPFIKSRQIVIRVTRGHIAGFADVYTAIGKIVCEKGSFSFTNRRAEVRLIDCLAAHIDVVGIVFEMRQLRHAQRLCLRPHTLLQFDVLTQIDRDRHQHGAEETHRELTPFGCDLIGNVDVQELRVSGRRVVQLMKIFSGFACVDHVPDSRHRLIVQRLASVKKGGIFNQGRGDQNPADDFPPPTKAHRSKIERQQTGPHQRRATRRHV